MITSFSSNQDLEKIFKIQKKTFALSQTPHIMPIAHTAPLFAKHKILPLNKIILKAKLPLMHSIHYNYAPPSLKHMGQKKLKTLYCKISITPFKKPGITYHAQTGKALNAGLGIHSFQKNTMLLCSFTFFIKERSVLCILLLSL